MKTSNKVMARLRDRVMDKSATKYDFKMYHKAVTYFRGNVALAGRYAKD